MRGTPSRAAICTSHLGARRRRAGRAATRTTPTADRRAATERARRPQRRRATSRRAPAARRDVSRRHRARLEPRLQHHRRRDLVDHLPARVAPRCAPSSRLRSAVTVVRRSSCTTTSMLARDRAQLLDLGERGAAPPGPSRPTARAEARRRSVGTVLARQLDDRAVVGRVIAAARASTVVRRRDRAGRIREREPDARSTRGRRRARACRSARSRPPLRRLLADDRERVVDAGDVLAAADDRVGALARRRRRAFWPPGFAIASADAPRATRSLLTATAIAGLRRRAGARRARPRRSRARAPSPARAASARRCRARRAARRPTPSVALRRELARRGSPLPSP